MVVVTFSGVPMLGGIVICGSTGWILLFMNWSLTSEAMRLDLPVPSSPQTHIRTDSLMPVSFCDALAAAARHGAQGRDSLPVTIVEDVICRGETRKQEIYFASMTFG